MKENHFVFADISTYDLSVAKEFYRQVFGWKYQSDGSGYWTASFKGKDVSGLYETPQKFKDMGMPSFWMSYMQVNDLEGTVAKAKELGGIIEVVETDNPIGKIALIRDPLGAGFTIYEGDLLNARTANTENTLVWNELFISDIQKVKGFYEGIFNWTIRRGVDARYDILDSKGDNISAIQELSYEIKGKYEYWAVYFGAKDPGRIKEKVIANEGSLLYEEENFTALADRFGAFFHVIPLDNTGEKGPESEKSTPIPWKAWIGLGFVTLGLLMDWHWLWGIFFLL